MRSNWSKSLADMFQKKKKEKKRCQRPVAITPEYPELQATPVQGYGEEVMGTNLQVS